MKSNSKLWNVMDSGDYSGGLEQKRTMLGERLNLTGCEVSINSLPPNSEMPFHSHKLNEEIYMVIKGSGMFAVDDEVFPIREGYSVRVSPGANRGIKADDNGMVYICIQAEANSLTQATHKDGLMPSKPVVWE